MIIKGIALFIALLASFSAGNENGKRSEAEQSKIEIQNLHNMTEAEYFDDGSIRGLRNMDDLNGKSYYALYVETDDERVWDATEVTGEGENTQIKGYAVCRYYTDDLILAFEGKRYDEDVTNVEQITITSIDGNTSTCYAVYTTVSQLNAVMTARGENVVQEMVRMGALDASYLQNQLIAENS